MFSVRESCLLLPIVGHVKWLGQVHPPSKSRDPGDNRNPECPAGPNPYTSFIIPPIFDEREIRAGFGVDGPAGRDYVSWDAKAMA